MKMTKLFAGAVCLTMLTTACKKDDRQEPLGPIAGKWEATLQTTTGTVLGQTSTDTVNILVEGDYAEFRVKDTMYVVDHGCEPETNFYKINGSAIVFSDNAGFTGESNDTFRLDYIRASEMSFSHTEIISRHGVLVKAKVSTIFKK